MHSPPQALTFTYRKALFSRAMLVIINAIAFDVQDLHGTVADIKTVQRKQIYCGQSLPRTFQLLCSNCSVMLLLLSIGYIGNRSPVTHRMRNVRKR